MRTMPPTWDYDCAVIGGGPGGLVSALYLRRFKRKTILIESGKPRAAWIPRTHNLLGFENGISGSALLRKLRIQVNRLGLDSIQGEARLERRPNGFAVFVGDQSLKARTVILATGIEDVQPDLPNLERLRRRGLLRYCSICDGYEFRDEPITVIARGDEGVQKAIFLSHWTRRLRILLPSHYTLARQRVAEIRAVGARLIRYKKGFSLEERLRPKGLWIYIDSRPPFECTAAYVELGCVVRDSAFRSLRGLRRTQAGFLLTSSEQRTNIPGLFAVGDCVNVLGQISVAAGQAAVAATAIHNDLFSL